MFWCHSLPNRRRQWRRGGWNQLCSGWRERLGRERHERVWWRAVSRLWEKRGEDWWCCFPLWWRGDPEKLWDSDDCECERWRRRDEWVVGFQLWICQGGKQRGGLGWLRGSDGRARWCGEHECWKRHKRIWRCCVCPSWSQHVSDRWRDGCPLGRGDGNEQRGCARRVRKRWGVGRERTSAV